MLKKRITYVDYENNERSEDFYFNLTQAEVFQMEISTPGGMTRLLEKIASEQDGKRMVEYFKTIIDSSYGVKSEDGRRFIKSTEILDNFRQTEAYSKLFMELATNADAAAAFINGIIPQNSGEVVSAQMVK